MDRDDIEFEAILAPHRRQTKARASKTGRSLLIHDKTEISFSARRDPIEGLGPTGKNKRQGFYLHTALKIDDDGQDILGLARPTALLPQTARRNAATASVRRSCTPNGGRGNRRCGVRLIEQVGPAPAGQTFVHARRTEKPTTTKSTRKA